MRQRHRIDTVVGPLEVGVGGDGPPCVLWHSLFVDEHSFDGILPSLERERRVISISGPGHGSSGDPGRRYTTDDCAAAALTILDQLGVDGAVDWVGNAWGGHVGVTVAATAPPRVRSLVTLGTPIAALSRPERARTWLLLALHTAGLRGAIIAPTTAVLLSPHSRAHNRAAVDYVDECLRHADGPMLRNAVVSISLHRQDLGDRLRRITAPTLIVTGADHHGFTPAQARAAAATMPDGRALVIPNAAYLLPLECPEPVATATLSFWAQTVTTRG